VDQYWTGSVVSGSGTGRQLLGCLFKTTGFSVDRNAGQHIEFTFGALANQDIEITSAAPTPTWPTQDPYVGNLVYIDLEAADATGAFTAWTGDNGDVKSFSYNYDNGVEVQRFAPSSTASENLTWTKAFPGVEKVTMEVVLYFANSDYVDYHRIADARKFRVRMMGVGSNPSFSGVADESLTAGVDVLCTPTGGVSGLANGDVVLLISETEGFHAVGTAGSVSATSGDFEIDTLDITLDGSGTNTDLSIQNTAWQIQVHELDLTQAPTIQRDGNAATVTLSLEGILASGQSSLVDVTAYDDDAT
jgi:hypothetical protein